MQRFIARHGLTTFTMNPHFPVNSLLAMRGLVASGVDAAYVDAVLAGFWERGLKMDDPAVLQAVLDEAGLDGARLLAATQDPAIKQQLAANTSAAVDRGVFGIPTFFVGKDMFFGKDRLGQVEEQLANS
jgi:2-hydroxychromene-2-carboxylate isomerase